jgi:hypothetical protein
MLDEDSLRAQVSLVQWAGRQAHGGRAETEARQTWRGAGKAEEREDHSGVKVAGEKVASEVKGRGGGSLWTTSKSSTWTKREHLA